MVFIGIKQTAKEERQMAKIDDFVFLNGRPPIGEFVGFVKSMAIDGSSIDTQNLINEWRIANDHVNSVQQSEANIVNSPGIKELSPTLLKKAEELMSTTTFKKSFYNLPIEIKYVELEKIIVYQKFINTTYVENLKTSIKDKTNEQEIFEFAFSIGKS
jgi:hypothetical protein